MCIRDRKVTVTDAGSGYTTAPIVTIAAPSESWGIQATALATIKNGAVDEITIISTGRGYTSTPSITVTGSATASLTMLPKYYSIKESTPISSGISTITLSEMYLMQLELVLLFLFISRVEL